MARLSAARRHALPTSAFADQKNRAYPEDTKARAVAAESYAKRYASPELLAKVRRIAHARYPSLGKKAG